MRPSFCGLDFGTSNSTLAVIEADSPRLLPLEDRHTTVPSAVFYGTEPDTAFLIGRAAMTAYVDGLPGRLMRSLKSVLGSALVDERTAVHRRRISFADVIGQYLAVVKRRAERILDRPLEAVVHGRPVHFVDGDPAADARAEATLRRIALKAGYAEVSFQFEPVAAAYEFERQIDREHLALIADIGGGTSDFTVVRLGPARARAADRSADILANAGLRLGGTDYDRQLSMAAFMPLFGLGSRMKRGDTEVPAGPYWDLSTWHTVHDLYEPRATEMLRTTRYTAAEPQLIERLMTVIEQKRGHSVLVAVEAAKIGLSDAPDHAADLGWIEPGLVATTTRALFETASERMNDRLRQAAAAVVAEAGLTPEAITALFFTGGTSQIPSVREALAAGFPAATLVDGDRFGAVGLGLAIEARRRYG